jgi:hypothetical protein
MKISDLLCQYLYQNKELVLEGFGVFHLDPSVNPSESKEPQQVYQGITFENNNKLKTAPEFIDFLVYNSGKMKPLAISDLEAFLTTGRELLNLGKPLILNGIGTLTGYKPQALDFTPGPFIPMRLDAREGVFRERVATSEDELFGTEDSGGSRRPTANQGRLILLGAAALLILLLIGWGVYHFLSQKKEGADTTAIQSVDSGTPVAQKDTTSTAKPDTGATVSPATPVQLANREMSGPVSFRVLIQTFADQGKAQRRYDSLKVWGHNVILETRDSTHYSILMPFSLPLADTTPVKDSLSTFFGRPVHVLLGQ